MQELKEFSETVQTLVNSAIQLNSYGFSDEAEEILKLAMLIVRQYKKYIQVGPKSFVSALHPKQ